MGVPRKLVLVPWFGSMPSWISKWHENVETIKQYGYEIYMPTDFAAFVERVKETLDIVITPFKDPRKVCDFRPAFGLIYAKELQGYDFWGHTDPDTVFGRVNAFISDETLTHCDIVSNDIGAVCGPFSLFRNTATVNELFKRQPDWRKLLVSERFEVFDEGQMTTLVKQSSLRVTYLHSQPSNPSDLSGIQLVGDKLYDGGREIMMVHFNRTKVWPC